jgi:hypothetical protein
VPADAFAAYERTHQRLVTRVVGPLFAGEGVTILLLPAVRPRGLPLLPAPAGAACLAVVLGVAASLAVPLHRGHGMRRRGRCSPPGRRVTLVAVGASG